LHDGPAFHILGGGLAGLAAAIELGDDCTLIEAEDRLGGLARSKAIDINGIGRFWFDHVLHLLYFPDAATAARIFALAGESLAPCKPVAFVKTTEGIVRYPLQMHLAGLPLETRVRCLADLACAQSAAGAAANFEEALLQTFGPTLCDLFLFPYNRKAWARPLSALRGQLGWTITRPDFEQVLRGALTEEPGFNAYNVDGSYPRPPAGSSVRGMEVLVRDLAAHVRGARTGQRVKKLDPEARRIEIQTADGDQSEAYRTCLATIPLPRLIDACTGVPADLRAKRLRLLHNRVWTVAFCLRGPVPPDSGHWRYYGDESLCFTRLVFMNAFDPLAAPEGCWGLMAEIAERAEEPRPARDLIIAAAVDSAKRAGVIDARQEILGTSAWVIDPAYVVFSDETEDIVGEAGAWFAAHDIHLLGRYGRWEYSSMAQVMRDGFALAARLKAGHPA
jgi:protoporphyrinogen oxidase